MASWRNVHKNQRTVALSVPGHWFKRSHRGFFTDPPSWYSLAKRFFKQAISHHPCPLTVIMDKYAANHSAVDSFNTGFNRYKPITIRQNKYLNNRIEQDHRAIKRRTKWMLGFKAFRSAQILLGGIELMHMLRKNQFSVSDESHRHAQTNFVCWLPDNALEPDLMTLRIVNATEPKKGDGTANGPIIKRLDSLLWFFLVSGVKFTVMRVPVTPDGMNGLFSLAN